MRSQVIDGFRAEIEQDLHDKLQMVHNMMVVYLDNGGDNEAVIYVSANIEETQQAIDMVGEGLAVHSSILSINANSLLHASNALNLDEGDARYMQNFISSIRDIDLVLRQSDYNRFAIEFNLATQRGLGFLTHNGVLGYRQLPIFE